jgi:polar amino acid transport system permease protein
VTGPAAGWTPSVRQVERLAVRRRLRARSALVATGATVVVIGLLLVGVTASPGWPTFRETFLSWPDAAASFPTIWEGFWKNVVMFLVAEPLILLVGALVAITRSTTAPALFPLRLLAVVYTDVLRGIPTILLVFVFCFGVPALRLQGVTNSLMWLGVTALVLSYGAYVAEVFRAGIESVHPSQLASAAALGLSSSQSMRHVVLPQAVRRVVPPLLNDFVSLQKDTALVGAVGVFEALYAARDYANYNFNFTSYLVAAVLFIVLTVPLARFTDWLGRRYARRERAGAR